ncbi:MAG: PKD domain-containing protein [Bacteroidales bacterium]
MTERIKHIISYDDAPTGMRAGLLLLVILLFSFFRLSAQTDTEFWFVAPEVTSGHGASGGEPIKLKITTQALPATIRITQPANAYHATNNPGGFPEILLEDIPANEVREIDLTPFIDIIENRWWGPDPKNDFGLHITATNMITAYYEVGTHNNPDIFSLKGRNALGTEFYTPFQISDPNHFDYTPMPYSAIDIVATRDGTEITITTRKASTLGVAGVHTISLDRGQTYSVAPAGYSLLAADRLDGTKITSNYPIAVTIKDDSVAASNGGCKDLIGDQLIPTSIIGHEYIIMKGRLSLINEYAYILATVDNTQIYIDDVYTATIDEGETWRYLITDFNPYTYISTRISPTVSAPSYVLHVAGFGCEMGGGILPPVNVCTGSTQVGFTRSKAESFFLNIMVRADAQDGFLFNGAPHAMLDAAIFQPIPGTTDWLAANIGSIGTGTIPVGVASMISNTKDVFHLGIINGGETSGTMYGYFSDFNALEIRANVAGTTSNVLRTCYGVPAQLFASGGTKFKWEPHIYLDDPFSPTPWVNPLESRLYTVTISGACNMDADTTISVQVSTPVEAMFTFEQGSVCAPETVNFENHSSGGKNFRWYVDDVLIMEETLTLKDSDNNIIFPPPIASNFEYTFQNTTDTPEVRRIELRVRNGDGCSDFITREITVYPEIVSGFTATPLAACDPAEISFTNTSSGNTDKWFWNFKDGTSSPAEHPTPHIFFNRDLSTDTTYMVSLTAISPFQCRDTFIQAIVVSPYLEAGFTFDDPSGCAPFDLVIADQSVGATEYHWTFGDGNGSPLASPVHTYQNEGASSEIYTVRQAVRNAQGCVQVMERDITVHPRVTAGFTATPEEGCSPHTVNFTNSSYGAIRYEWDFGDGTSSTETMPVHTYPVNLTGNGIIYEVTLSAFSAEGCMDIMVEEVTVHPWIEASFTIDNTAGCHPLTITINNNSAGADQYLWTFGDGSDDSDTGASSFNRTFRNTGSTDITYRIELEVTNNQGCTDVAYRDIVVYPEITANFIPTPDDPNICEPLTVSFNDWSKNAAKWDWDFGDGTGSDLQSPSHEYFNTGTGDISRQVRLTTTSANGLCTATNSWNIIVHGRVEADFEVGANTGCNPFEVDFINHSTGGASYIWDFGDGQSLSTTSADMVTHSFSNSSYSAMREYDITLIVENYAGCISETTKTINVYPDIEAAFTPSVIEGCHPLTVDFINESLGAHRYEWDFGDGGLSSETSPVRTFTNTGTENVTYRVLLTAIAGNNVCRDTEYADIVVSPYVKAEFSLPENLGCNPFDVSIENNSVHATSYFWDFGDGTDNITYNKDTFVKKFNNNSFTSPAAYNITMRAQNDMGCSDEISRSISVYPDILAEFEASDTIGCHPLSVDFLNTSLGASRFTWDFGDGSSSSQPNPSHIFTNTGLADSVYTITLYTTAANNICTDSYTIDITVHPYVKADFTFPESISCTPFDLEFSNSSVGGEKYTWTFGDGSDTVTYNTDSFFHRFTNSLYAGQAKFPVLMVAENFAGCTDRIEKTVSVYNDIQANFVASVIEDCHPLVVNFTNMTRGGHSYEWDFGDGVTSTAHSPGHTFINAGSSPIVRRVTLRAFSETYCTSQYSIDITIHPNPRARFEIDNAITCAPFNLPIVNTSIDADKYRWIFGDGETFDTGSNSPFNHIYDNQDDVIKNYTLKLIASTDFGCADSASQPVRVYPRVNTSFTSITEGCSPLQVNFTNHTTGAVNYQWDFGDGPGIGIKDPRHTYFNNSFNDTTWFVRLVGISEYGCSDTSGYGIEVYPQPVAEFTVSPVFQEYPSTGVDIVNESKDGLWQYRWDFDDGNTTSLKDPGLYQFGDWGDYNISLMVSNDNCSDATSHRIYIQPPMPVASFDLPDRGCIPHTVRFTNTSVYGHSYYWDFDDGNTSREIEPTHTFTQPGVYQVRLTVTGEGGEHFTYREVEAYRKPFVHFKAVPDTVLLPDANAQLYNMSEYGVRYEWDFGDGNYSAEKEPSHLYTALGVYDINLSVWTEHGCTDNLYIERAVTVDGEGLIIFPNAFRPSTFGPSGGYYDLADPASNAIFHPYWEGVSKYRLRIYNRWGEFLFESNDIMQGWDGYYNGKLSKQDVYVWKVWVSFTNGSKLVDAGDVTLMR